MQTLTKAMPFLPLLAFLSVAAVLLGISHVEVLYVAHTRSLFLEGSSFMFDCLRRVGGGLEWGGRYLTSLFFHPWLGIGVLCAIWSAVYVLLYRSCRAMPSRWRWLLVVPLCALLVSVTDLGYWAYYLKLHGYWMRESLGLLCVVLLLCPSGRRWSVVMAVVAALCYPLVGWYSVFALGVMMLRGMVRRCWLQSLLPGILLAVVPSLVVCQYVTLRVGDAWTAGFPFIAANLHSSWLLTLPFLVMIISVAVIHVVPWERCAGADGGGDVYDTVRRRGWAITMLVVTLQLVASWFCGVRDYNYHAEIRMYRAVEEHRWGDVLSEFQHLPQGPTRQMVMCKNIALLNTGHLGDLLFRFPNNGPSPLPRDSSFVHLAQTAAPLFYLHHGLANNATHWCIENGVEYGFSLNDLRILALSALISGEGRLAEKYLQMLSLTPFGGSFVRRYYPLAVHPEWISEYPELQLMRELHDDRYEYLLGDDGLCEWGIYKAFSNQLVHDSDRAQELALAYSMMRKDYELIWHHFGEYVRRMPRGAAVPVHYQEAALLGTRSKKAPYSLDNFPFDASLRQTFLSGQYPQGTFWWFFFNCNDARQY